MEGWAHIFHRAVWILTGQAHTQLDATQSEKFESKEICDIIMFQTLWLCHTTYNHIVKLDTRIAFSPQILPTTCDETLYCLFFKPSVTPDGLATTRSSSCLDWYSYRLQNSSLFNFCVKAYILVTSDIKRNTILQAHLKQFSILIFI